MRESILQHFEICTREIELATDLIIGMMRSRQVSSTALASYIKGEANTTSKIRRIERFYSDDYIDSGVLLDAIHKMFGKHKFKLSLDRTNWEFGESDINAFTAFAHNGDVGSMIGLNMLDNKGGNSNSLDRISLAKAVIEKYGKERIKSLLGDREFLSIEFAAWLLANDIPFVLRARENLGFLKPYLRHASDGGKIFRNVSIGEWDGEEIRCDLSIKKLKDEYLIVVSHKIRNALEEYRERWKIECFFKMLKTGGLNIKNTKITDPNRLLVLFLLCGIAYLLCVRLGIYRHMKVKEIRWRPKYKCYEYCYFRWGLDWLRDILLHDSTEAQPILSSVFTHV